MSTTLRIPFKTQTKGYDQEQVDKYVQKLAEEYRALQQKYNDLSESRIQAPVNAEPVANIKTEAISKAMVDAEVKAIQIVAEAKNEANRIIGKAYTEVEQLQLAKERALLEIQDLMNNLKDVIPAAHQAMTKPMQSEVEIPGQVRW